MISYSEQLHQDASVNLKRAMKSLATTEKRKRCFGCYAKTPGQCHGKKQKLHVSANKLALVVLDATTSYICAKNVIMPITRVNNNCINLDWEKYCNQRGDHC